MEVAPSVGKIHEAMAAIMGEVGGVGKTRKNEQQNYKYRGVADITLACQPVMARHGVTLVPHQVKTDSFEQFTTAKGSVMFQVRQTIRWRFYHADGSFCPAETTGEGMDSGDKATNKAMTAAQKYALTQAFSIPEDDPADSEKDSHEVTGKIQPGPAQAPVNRPTGKLVGASKDDTAAVFEACKLAGAKTKDDAHNMIGIILPGVERVQGIPVDQLPLVFQALAKMQPTTDADAPGDASE